MISFGDTVMVLDRPEASALGLAGRQGQVYGETVPSHGHAELIAESESDFGVCVIFEDTGEEYWLPVEMVTLVHHTPGTEMRLAGVDKKWVREADGSWREESTKPKPWWKFW